MKPTMEILTKLQENSRKHHDEIFTRLFRYLLRPDIYYIAYQHLYANDGAGTKGVDEDTADGFSEAYVERIIEALRTETYRPKPVRRTYIQKSNGKMRPLGLPTFTDKLVQEVMRMILEAVYEPVFSRYSHGFRPGRSCHTALAQIKHEFVGACWFVEGDIKGCFDNIDHTVLTTVIGKKIKDAKFLKLIQLFLKSGYMEDWKYYGTYSGCPQGGIISPVLANIYLNELDKDGIPMVYHDPTLTRLTGVNKKVEDLTAEQLQSLTLSTEGQYVKGKIPTLRQLIQTMKTWEGETGLLIELKPVNDNQAELAEKVIDVVESEDFAARSIFMSLDYEAVQILQRQRPQWWIGYCVYGTAGEMDYRIWNWNIDFLAVEESQISVSFLEQAGRAWMPVYVWTVDNYDKMSNYLDMGVSGLITNYPDLAREEIDDYMQRYPQYYQYQGKGYPIYEWETE